MPSPVRTDRPNLVSEVASRKRTSAESFAPALMIMMSPGTMSDALIVVCRPLQMTMASSGIMPVMESMTREVLKSCQPLKMAWMTNTAAKI